MKYPIFSKTLSLGIVLVIACLFLVPASCNAPEGTKDNARNAREYSYSSYYPDEDKNKFTSYAEYPPSNYVTYKEDAPSNCPPSPLIPVLSNGLNFLALKLGALGLIKSFFALLFIIFLFKLPILLAKAAFLKAVLFPALLAPLMMLYSGSMGNTMMNAMMPDAMKPTETTTDEDNSNGRAMDYAIASTARQGLRLLLDSEKCAERMACQLGVLNNDTMSGAALGRMAKYIEHSSPSSTKFRIRSLREAFTEGNTAGTCSPEIYKCQPPELILAQGDAKMRVL